MVFGGVPLLSTMTPNACHAWATLEVQRVLIAFRLSADAYTQPLCKICELERFGALFSGAELVPRN